MPEGFEAQPLSVEEQADPANEQADILEQFVTLKINGIEQEMSMEDVIVLAQKNGAADQALADAKKLARDNQQKISIGENLLKARGGDRDALIAMFVEAGNPREEVESAVDTILQQYSGAPLEGAEQGANQQGEPAMSAEDIQLLKDFKGFRDNLKRAGIPLDEAGTLLAGGITGQARMNRATRIRNAVDAHPGLQDLYKSAPDSVVDIVQGYVDRASGGGELTEDVLQRGLKQAATALKALPVAGRSATEDIALGPYSGLTPAEVKKDAPTKMPPIHSAEHGSAMTKLLGEIDAQLTQGKGARAY